MRELQETNILLLGIGKTLDELQGCLDATIHVPVIISGTIKKINAEIIEAIKRINKLEEAKKNIAETERYRLTLKTFCTLLHAGLKNAKDDKYYTAFLYSSEGQAIISFMNSSDPEIEEEKTDISETTAQRTNTLSVNPSSSFSTLNIFGFFGNTTKAIAATIVGVGTALLAMTLVAKRNDISPNNKFLFFGLIAGVFVAAKYGINHYIDEPPNENQKNFRWKNNQ